MKDYSGRTHLDILNGLFGLNLRGHQMAMYRLNDTEVVWFPHVSRKPLNTVDNFGANRWANWISQDGRYIYEKWPDEEGRVAVRKNFSLVRYTFAHHIGEGGYRFVGVFRHERTDIAQGVNVYGKIDGVEELEALIARVTNNR